MFDQVFWRAISGQVNRWRRNVLHLGNTSLDRMQPHKIPFLYNFSPTLVPPPLDWPEWIRITGMLEFNQNDNSLSQVIIRILVPRRRRSGCQEMDSTT